MNNDKNPGTGSDQRNGQSRPAYDGGLMDELSVINDAACALLSKLIDESCTVIDFGCGSGDTATALQAHGLRHLVGLDVSSEKLQSAEKRQCYEKTIQRDLNLADGSAGRYDAGVCVNVIGFSEIGLEHFTAMLSMLAEDAPLVISVSAQVWDSQQWPQALDEAQTEGNFTVEYMKSVAASASDENVRLLLIRNTALEPLADEQSD